MQYVVGLRDELKAQYDQIKLVLDRKINRNIMAKLHDRRAKDQNLQIGDLVLELAPGRGLLKTIAAVHS